MANSKQWYTMTDVALPSFDTAAHANASVVWLFKQLLIGNGGGTLGPEGAASGSAFWTVDQSCDSSSTDTSGTDLWLTSFNAAKIVSGTGAHSWIVLKSPLNLSAQGVYYYLTFDLNNASSAAMTVRLSKSTRPSSGTTSAAPTAAGDLSFSAFSFTDNTAPASGGKCHRTIDANGNFWLLYGKTGAGSMQTALQVNRLTNLRVGSDAYDVVVSAEMNQPNVLKETVALLQTNTSTVKGYTYGGTSTNLTVPTLCHASGSSYYASGNSTAAHPSDNLWEGQPCTLYVLGQTSNNQAKGDLPDAYYASAAISQGSRNPTTGTMEKVLIGQCWLPFSVVPSL